MSLAYRAEFSLGKGSIYKMFGSHHFQALKNDRQVGQHNFFHSFYVFNIFIPGREI